MNGHGVFIWSNGDRWEGGFVKEKRDGYGIWTKKDGTKQWEYYRNGTCTEISKGTSTVIITMNIT